MIDIDNYLQNLIDDYCINHIKGCYDFYSDVPNSRLSFIFSKLHYSINDLFRYLNSCINERHLTDGSSRSLKQWIEIIFEVQNNLLNTELQFEINEDYETTLKECLTFLCNIKNGSKIPLDFQKIDIIISVRPIFNVKSSFSVPIQSISKEKSITTVIKNYYEINKARIKSLYHNFKSQNHEYESYHPEKLSKVNVDILLTTATDTESYILHGYLKPIGDADKILRVYKGNYVYYIAQLGCYVIVHVQSKAGSNTLGGSYDVLNEAISIINPKMIFSIGIAFGINPDKQKIGDVLVATTIFPYDMNKISEGEMKIKNPWFPKTSEYLSNRIAQSKVLSGTGYTLLQGGIVSGGSVVDDIEYKKMILNPFKTFDIIGGEMEAYGVYKQAFENNVMCITIKSVCDYAECKNSLSDDMNENEMIKDGIQLLGMDNVCKVIEYSFKDKYIFSDLNITSNEEFSIKKNQTHGKKISDNKYVEQAKKMILSRYIHNQAKPDHMIMTNELLQMKYDCKNPKVADAIVVAIKELIEAGFVYESGLGIHLSNKGYDSIF